VALASRSCCFAIETPVISLPTVVKILIRAITVRDLLDRFIPASAFAIVFLGTPTLTRVVLVLIKAPCRDPDARRGPSPG